MDCFVARAALLAMTIFVSPAPPQIVMPKLNPSIHALVFHGLALA